MAWLSHVAETVQIGRQNAKNEGSCYQASNISVRPAKPRRAHGQGNKHPPPPPHPHTHPHKQTDRKRENAHTHTHTYTHEHKTHAHTTSLARSDTFDTHQQTLLVLDAPRPIQTISQRFLKRQDTSLNHTAWPSCCPEHTYTPQVVVDPKVGFAGGRKDGNKYLQASLQQKTSKEARTRQQNLPDITHTAI